MLKIILEVPTNKEGNINLCRCEASSSCTSGHSPHSNLQSSLYFLMREKKTVFRNN